MCLIRWSRPVGGEPRRNHAELLDPRRAPGWRRYCREGLELGAIFVVDSMGPIRRNNFIMVG